MTNHDLIQKIGGYESARKLLRDQSGMDPEVSINGEMVLVDIVDDALLKYRTERGIFEVGDFVVSECDEDIPILFETIEMQHASFDWCVGCRSMSGLITCYLAINKIRHATPQEIKTGHRIELSGISGQLEVLEMIHISPSCVVIER